MVGRLTDGERQRLAQMLLSFRKDEEVLSQLDAIGYHLRQNGRTVTDPRILLRLATLSLDTLDVTPVAGQPLLDVLSTIREVATPPWLERVRRCSALLMGSAAQAGRPIRLSREWKGLARRVLAER